jgi:predicted PurR-regulated permease PerM
MDVTDPTAPAPAPAPGRRREGKILLAFLAVFLVLLLAFRAVLFPFLMAMFLAYLVEPLVAWVGKRRRLGVQWGRGTTLLIMYSVVLTGMFLLGSCAIGRLDATIRNLRETVTTQLQRIQEKAVIRVVSPDGNAPAAIEIPQGTEVFYDPPAHVRAEGTKATDPEDPPLALYRTAYYAVIPKGEPKTEVLLQPKPLPAPAGATMDFRDPSAIRLPAETTLKVEATEPAKGLEVFLQTSVIEPIAAQIGKVTGGPVDPGWIRRVVADESRVQGADIGKRFFNWSQGLLFTVFKSTYTLILVLMLTGFIVVDRRRISEFFESLPPPHLRDRYRTLIRYVDRGLAGVIRGQLVICLLNGILTYLGLVVYGIRYAELLAVVAGVFSLIPVFGTIASSIPIVLVALGGGGVSAGLFALAWICLIHLLEANLLNPLVMGSSAEMHPVIIIFALLAGEHAFGVWGALLAVPTASIIQSCFKFWRHEILGMPVGEYHGHGKWLRDLLARKKSRKQEEGTNA